MHEPANRLPTTTREGKQEIAAHFDVAGTRKKAASSPPAFLVGSRPFVTLKRQMRDAWATAKWSAALTVFAGIVVLLLRTPLERWSYDLPQNLGAKVEITNVAIVYMDDATHTFLHQTYDASWDRSFQAKLVEALTQAGATAVAFDVLFNEPGTNAAATKALADAISHHRRVVLAADLGSGDYYGLASEIKLMLPPSNFLAATPYWGFSQLYIEGDDEVRQHFHGWEDVPSLSWKLASLLGAKTTKEHNGQRKERWLRYYGPRGTLPGLSFHKALNVSDPAVRELFHDRVVFVGSATEPGPSGKRRDRFRTPYWGSNDLWPGVDFHATQFLNLMRGDWLRRIPPLAEIGLLGLAGALAALGLALLKPQAAALAALGAAILVAAAACMLVWQTHFWFAWLVITVVQLPIALACSVVRRAELATTSRPTDLTTDFSSANTRTGVLIPDYEMLRKIGSGSYGEVWLARSATGTFRAVKVVDRKSAQDPRFAREFEGLKNFEPISRAHEGLVQILHVGRNEGAGQLYYVMELADSCANVEGDDAEGYIPTTLKTKLQARGSLDTEELARLSLALTSALAFLHEQGLLHRDIKPSNIIFVQGRPKLADIGLVAAADETHSFVGTEGYIPPEGPGTPAADVYSLGKVFSELLAETREGSASDQRLRRFRRFVEQACSKDLAERPATGKEMLEQLRAAVGA